MNEKTEKLLEQVAYIEYVDCGSTYWASLRRDTDATDPAGYYVSFGVKREGRLSETARMGGDEGVDRITALRCFLNGPRNCLEQSPAEREAEHAAQLERIRSFGRPA